MNGNWAAGICAVLGGCSMFLYVVSLFDKNRERAQNKWR